MNKGIKVHSVLIEIISAKLDLKTVYPKMHLIKTQKNFFEYPNMAGLYGTAYAANFRSEKHSSDFG